MNSSIYRFTLDLQSTQSQISIPVSQWDTAREWHISFSDGGRPYYIADDCLVALHIRKPDGSFSVKFDAFTNNDTVIFNFEGTKTTNMVGVHDCTVVIYDGQYEDLRKIIASPRFTMIVNKRAVNPDDLDITPEDELNLDTILAEEANRRAQETLRVKAEEERQAAEATRVSAENARVEADRARDTRLDEAIGRIDDELGNFDIGNYYTKPETENLIKKAINVVQTTGDSENAVMSQKAVSNIFSTYDRRVTNLEHGVAEQFETDSSVAYIKVVPENALPYAEIKKIGGMTYVDYDYLNTHPVTEVEIVGANLFDGEVLDGYRGSHDGTYYNITGEFCTNNFIPVLPNTQYCVSKSANYVIFFDTYKNYLSSQYYTASQPFTTPQRAAYMHVNFGNVETSDIMINKGSTSLPYAPYVKNIFPIPAEEVVQALDGYGFGINESAYNYIDYEKKQFVKRVGKDVFDGTEGWNSAYSSVLNNTAFSTTVSVDCLKSDTKPHGLAISNAFPFNAAGGDVADTFRFSSGLYDKRTIWFYPSAQYTLEEWKAWLAANPVTVLYELATPIITDISDILPDDNFIKVEGNGMLIFINGNNHAVPSEITYQVPGGGSSVSVPTYNGEYEVIQ